MATCGSCPTLNIEITCAAQEVLGIPKGKEVNLVSSGYPGLAYLPHTPGVVVTLGFRDPTHCPATCSDVRPPVPKYIFTSHVMKRGRNAIGWSPAHQDLAPDVRS